MKWTTETPTEPGWYWCDSEMFRKPKPVLIQAVPTGDERGTVLMLGAGEGGYLDAWALEPGIRWSDEPIALPA